MPILKKFQCEHCLKKRNKIVFFVVMETKIGTLIPVDVQKEEKVLSSEVYNGHKRNVHWIICKERWDDWDQIKSRFYDPAARMIITEEDVQEELKLESFDIPNAKVPRELTTEEIDNHKKKFAEILAAEIREKGISNAG